MTTVDDIVGCLEGAKRVSDGYMVRCPAHNDRTPSLHVWADETGAAAWDCKAGCEWLTVTAELERLGLDVSGRLSRRRTNAASVETTVNPFKDPWTPRGPATATYPYTDADCRLLYCVCRTADKQFPVWRPDSTSKTGKRWKVKGLVDPVLYHLPRLLAAVKARQTIYVVDGEKDVEALERAGRYATTDPHWAGGWAKHPEYATWLAGADVVVVADKDSGAGHRQADAIADALKAAS